MKKILNIIISSHYFSVIVSFMFFILSSLELIYIKNNIHINECINETKEIIIEKNNETVVVEDIPNLIYVDIKGEVKKPGVYKIEYGSRVSEVIELSGGLTKNANTRFINLSKIVNDGDVIVIYSNNEIKKATKVKTETIYVNTPCICEEVKNDACLIENLNIENPINENNNNETVIEEDNGKININTASKEELMSLSGIGEAKAKAISEYREKNGLFKDIKDIVNVSGISETIYSKIKENITV